MKTSGALSILALAAPISAFPALMLDANSVLHKRQNAAAPQGVGALPLIPPPFDAASQLVSVSGQYAFKAPGSGDARGECPGLNAMANHGYIPHNGIATIQQFILGTYQVFGMAQDLSTFLAVYGAVIDGDGTSWSIEGAPHVGIGGSHNNYEADSSPLKSDLNQYGSNERLIMSQFQELYAMQPDASTANYNLAVMQQFRKQRFHESIAKNPYFAYLPFSGNMVTQAAYTFIYRFMSNKSAEYPEGVLNKAVLKSFMAITGPENNLKWTKGYERIPKNWYKRNDADQYSIPYFQADAVYLALVEPQILGTGCNQGTVNSYNAIDQSTLSSGAYTAALAAKNPICFGAAFALAEAPGVFGLNTAQTAQLRSAMAPAIMGLGCNYIDSVNTSALTVCPGFSLYGGPYGPVAPKAIQN